jgi:hypothetical protein
MTVSDPSASATAATTGFLPRRTGATPPRPGDDLQDATWVTLKEASGQAGVSVSWLRKQYRRSSLPTREEQGPRGPQKLVPLEVVRALAAPFAPSPPGGSVATLRPAPGSGQVARPGPAAEPEPAGPGRAAAPPDPAPAPSAAGARTAFSQAQPDRELLLIDRLVEAEGRAAQAETDAAHLRARLEAALGEIRRLRRLLAQAYDPAEG